MPKRSSARNRAVNDPSDLNRRPFHLSLFRFFWLSLTLFLIVLNSRLYLPTPPQLGSQSTPPDSQYTLSFIKSAIEDGSAAEMQALFPEGAFFLNVLYGLTWVNIGLHNQPGSIQWEMALAEARFAYKELEKEASISPFRVAKPLSPPYGIFYAGWRNYLLAGILLLQEDPGFDPTEREQFEIQSEQIAAALTQSQTPFLQAYPGAAWPVDMFPAMVSLKAYSRLIDKRYDPLIETWLNNIKGYLDPTTGLIPHRVDPKSGATHLGSRATSQTLILRFLYELDPDFGQEQYLLFREQYGLYTYGIPGVLEYPAGVAGRGDVDSGPLVAGASLSATTVMIGTARIYGDTNWGNSIWHAGEMLGLPIRWQDQKWYGFGVLPVGDAFAAWSKSSHAWLQPDPSIDEFAYDPIVPQGWRMRLHLLSLALISLPIMLRLFFRSNQTG